MIDVKEDNSTPDNIKVKMTFSREINNFQMIQNDDGSRIIELTVPKTDSNGNCDEYLNIIVDNPSSKTLSNKFSQLYKFCVENNTIISVIIFIIFILIFI